MLLGKGDQLLVEVERRHISGRVRRVTDYDRSRLRDRMPNRAFECVEEVRGWIRGHRTNSAACHQESECMDRIAWVRYQHNIARRCDSLCDVGEALLRAKRRDDLGIGMELHTEAPVVIRG